MSKSKSKNIQNKSSKTPQLPTISIFAVHFGPCLQQKAADLHVSPARRVVHRAAPAAVHGGGRARPEEVAQGRQVAIFGCLEEAVASEKTVARCGKFHPEEK